MTPLQKSILNAVKRRPMTLRELQNNLQVDNSRLRTTVSAMVATGELSMRNGTYVPGFATYENAAAPNTIPCTLVKLAARFGFASRDDGEGDIFIPGRALHGAMPQDKINVKLFDHPRVEGSSEGEVVEVTVPNNRFAGTVCLSEDGRLAVEPDGCRDVKFLLAKQGSEGVHLGDKVGFLITHRGNRHSDHRAAVVEIVSLLYAVVGKRALYELGEVSVSYIDTASAELEIRLHKIAELFRIGIPKLIE